MTSNCQDISLFRVMVAWERQIENPGETPTLLWNRNTPAPTQKVQIIGPPKPMQPTVLRALTHTGHACQLTDLTGRVSSDELRKLLDDLIATKAFGLSAISTDSATIKLDAPKLAHIQIGDELYRLLLFPYEGRIEKF